MKFSALILLTSLLLINILDANCQEVISKIESKPSWSILFLKTQKTDGKLRHYAYSSELDEVDPFEGGPGKYTMLNLFDNDPATAWVEGVKGYGEGQYVVFGLGSELPEKLVLRNGYQKNEGIFKSNSRLKTIKLSLYTGFFLEGEVTEIASVYRIKELIKPVTMLLRDMMGEQEIALMGLNSEQANKVKEQALADYKTSFQSRIDEVKEYCPSCGENPVFQYLVKIEIVDVYKGSKWDDTCISDLQAIYKKTERQGIPESDTIVNIYESENSESGIIYIDTNRERGLILIDKSKMDESKLTGDGTSFEIVLMDVSPDKEWAQVNIMFYEQGAGRVEEYSALYHIRSLQRVDSEVLGIEYGMSGFMEKDGKLYLDTVDGLIDLDELKLKL